MGEGSGNLAKMLRDTAEAIRPHIEAALDLTEIFADYRKTVTDAGGDWMALKNLVKAQVQDERDDSGEGKHVARIIEKADFAASYADMLGLGGAKLNENNSFAPQAGAESEVGQPVRGDGQVARRGQDMTARRGVGARTAPASQPASVRAPEISTNSDRSSSDGIPAVGTTPARRVADESRAPLTDQHGYMLDDIPANLRVRA